MSAKLTREERDSVCKRCGRGVVFDRDVPGRCRRDRDDDYWPRCMGSKRKDKK